MIKEKKWSKRDEKIYQKTKTYLEKIKDSQIEEKVKIIDKVLDISDKEERYSYLYDLICGYLDNEFNKKNICGFNCGICKNRQDLIDRNIKKDTYENGCCYFYAKGKLCDNLDSNGRCKVKNIGCKLFTCSYLKKRGYKYRLNDIYLARYFFNYRQKEDTLFVDKDVIINGILRRG